MRFRHGAIMHKHVARILAAFAIVAGAVQAAPVPGQGSWEKTLLGRDINGHAVSITDPRAEFAYDTVLDATWNLTANTTDLEWDDARIWAAGLTVGTFSGWSLPVPDLVCGQNYNCTNSQMGELYYTALGNVAFSNPGWGLSNTGPFKNLRSYAYWSGMEYAPLDFAWGFLTSYGLQFAAGKNSDLYSLAIRPGDLLVAGPVPVPEPETYAMLLAGLGLLAAMLRRRRRQPPTA